MLPGPTELALILVIILIVFGAGKLPQVMKSMGEGIKMFREAQTPDAGGSAPRDVTPRKEIADKAVEVEVVDPEKAGSRG